jgi:hypothetical protein
VYLLEILGFCMSKAKCHLQPVQTKEFLSFTVTSVTQELSLPSGKIKKMSRDTGTSRGRQVLIQKLSQLLGKLQAVMQAILLAPLFFCKLQWALRRGLEQSDQDYSGQHSLMRRC